MPSFFVGQRLRAVATVTAEPADVAYDPPGGTTFKFRDPSGTVTSITGSREAAGVYWATIALVTDGTWWGRFEGKDVSGNAIAAEEFPIEVVLAHF